VLPKTNKIEKAHSTSFSWQEFKGLNVKCWQGGAEMEAHSTGDSTTTLTNKLVKSIQTNPSAQ
jgi:hypothetical protein